MAKTYFNEQQIKKWFVDGREVKKAYFDNQLVFSSAFELVISASNHNVPANWIWTLLPPAQQQAQGNTIKIIVNQGVELVTASTAISGVFNFAGAWAGKTVIVENHGYILGRGGTGGGNPGGTGGPAIFTDGTANVTIYNHGVIGGGGGGGGQAGGRNPSTGTPMKAGGGGGAPFGAGGAGSYANPGAAGTFAAGGAGGTGQGIQAGSGGGWGQNGNAATAGAVAQGGPAGNASSGPITWAVLGDIRGARV